MQKITPFLWFDGNAEEAVAFYASVFKNAKVGKTLRMSDGGPVITAAFELEGLSFVALNGGPQFKFTEAVSFFIDCQSQAEVDYYWDRLSAGGSIQQCGWLKDRFGVSWQVIPTALIEMLGDPDRDKANRVMQAMLQMKKIDIAELKAARDG